MVGIGFKKLEASHNRYRALGPELMPVYRQSAHRWLLSHPPGGRLPLLSARPAVTFPAADRHRPLAGTKLYCLVTEAHRCEQLAQGCYAALPWAGTEPTTCWSQVQRSTHCATAPHGIGFRGSICVTVPNFMPISQNVVVIWRFTDFWKWRLSAIFDLSHKLDDS